MTPEDFVRGYLGLFSASDYNKESVRLLAGIVNTSKDGLISYSEFQAFEGLLCFPDALYKTAFQLFDTNGNGVISFGNFSHIHCTPQMRECYRKVWIACVGINKNVRLMKMNKLLDEYVCILHIFSKGQ